MRWITTLVVLMIIISAQAEAICGQFPIKIPKVPKIKTPAQTETVNPVRSGNGTIRSNETEADSVSSTDCQLEGAQLFLYNELNDTARFVSEYSPKKRTQLVIGAQAEWLLRAVSAREREKWSAEWLKTDCAKQKFGQGFAALEKAASEKLPIFVPAASNFANKNAREEKMMKDKLGDLTLLKVFNIGLYHGSWQIDANSLGIPLARYKQGFIWARNDSDDHSYCHLYQVNIVQDYSGGGTYAATYARYIGDTLFGCKAG